MSGDRVITQYETLSRFDLYKIFQSLHRQRQQRLKRCVQKSVMRVINIRKSDYYPVMEITIPVGRYNALRRPNSFIVEPVIIFRS